MGQGIRPKMCNGKYPRTPLGSPYRVMAQVCGRRGSEWETAGMKWSAGNLHANKEQEVPLELPSSTKT